MSKQLKASDFLRGCAEFWGSDRGEDAGTIDRKCVLQGIEGITREFSYDLVYRPWDELPAVVQLAIAFCAAVESAEAY